VILVPFDPAHVGQMRVQRMQAHELDAQSLADPYGRAWTAMADGAPVACGGLVEVWTGRAYAWALLSESAGPHMLALTRAIRSGLAQSPFRRVEMAVDAGFDAGRRWAELLGFRLETPEPMRAFLPNGRDAYLFART